MNSVTARETTTPLIETTDGAGVLQSAHRVLTYNGQTEKVTMSSDEPLPGRYYCKGIRGKGDAVDGQRYLREGVGVYPR
jgi:hypothetical protein